MALHAAVGDPQAGPALARSLRRTWPWALVDEFQDTDPLQYAILRRIYRPDGPKDAAGGEVLGGLALIGDPKQAIYAFRGGDVFVYLEAAADADGRYGMATNHRSTPAVVHGLDALFTAGGEQAFVLGGIRFLRVDAARPTGDRQLTTPAGPLAGVTAWSIPEDAGTSKGALQARIQNATIDRIAALLDAGRFVDAAGEARPLAPSDVVVLVNTNREAVSMQAALTAAGVPAVCIHQDSVFATEAARDLLWLLQAAATPLDPERLRRALITPLFGLCLGDLVALEADEAAWPAWMERLQAAHLAWGRFGVQAMLEPFLQQAAGRVLACIDGERRMTDYLHVAERLQQGEHEVFGREGLVRWLQGAIEHSDGELDDADRVRLEDDSELVQITTVHKAKGLQWPVVFVPFAPWLGTSGSGKPTDLPLVFHDRTGRSVIDLGSSDADASRPQAVREHKAEQMRSLYVAFTRAEDALYFVHGAAAQALDGPLAWLLHHGDGVVADQWHGGRKPPDWFDAARTHQRLLHLQKQSDGPLAVETLPQIDRPRQRPRPAEGALRPARSDFPKPPAPWSIFSFSRLAGRMSAAGEAVAGGGDEVDTPAVPDTADADDGAPGVIVWPRGAGFGRAFHEILETVDFAAWPEPGAALDAAATNLVTSRLRQHGIATAAGHRGAPVDATAALVAHTLHAPLPHIGALARLAPERRRRELEFFLRLGGSTADALLACIGEAGYAGARPGDAEARLSGLMHGFIDLVVEHEGRFWILDYKTNLLGETRAAYAPQRLRAAIGAHHYDLQYLIYSVALHRHLRQSLADYDPAAHLGGVLYLFVRGLDAGGEHGVFTDRPDPQLIVALDRLLDGREQAA